jgi:hypothetical protein
MYRVRTRRRVFGSTHPRDRRRLRPAQTHESTGPETGASECDRIRRWKGNGNSVREIKTRRVNLRSTTRDFAIDKPVADI